MDEELESSLVYDLKQSDKTCSVLSLKANSRLLKDLQTQDSQAFIVFTSTTNARITIGTEEYDLSFCDTKRTDAYEEIGDHEMALLGEVQGRLQVTNSRSNGGKETTTVSNVEKLNLYPELEPKKREISLLDVSAGMGGLVSTTQRNPESSNKKPKVSHSAMTTTATTPTTQTKRKPASSSYISETLITPAQPSFDLTTNLLLLGNIPVEVAASDVLGTLFSGLSVAAMYVCRHAGQDTVLSSLETNGAFVDATSTVDLYVEFNTLGGAELAMMRDGEGLSYKSALATSAGAASTSRTASAKSSFTRQSIVPLLQPVDTQLAFWVKHMGLKLCTPGTQSTSNLTSSTPIKRYIESVVDTLQLVRGSGLRYSTATSLIENVLHDPVVLARRWQPVVSQLLLPPGCMDAYSSDHTLRARVRKDTNYLFQNPAVADILLAHVPDYPTSDAKSSSDNAGKNDEGIEQNEQTSFLQDEGGQGLYSVEEDVQLRIYEHFLLEAERNVQYFESLWCWLSTCDKANNAEQIHLKYTYEMVCARLAFYKALYKEAWSLSVTYCVFG